MIHESKLTRALTSISMDKFKGHFGKAYGYVFSAFCHYTNGFHESGKPTGSGSSPASSCFGRGENNSSMNSGATVRQSCVNVTEAKTMHNRG